MDKKVYLDIEGICEKVGWSQNRLAKEMGVMPSTLSKIKRATMVSLTKTVQRIHEATGLGFDEIFIYR